MKKNAGKYLFIPFIILVFTLTGGIGKSLGQNSKNGVRFIIPLPVDWLSKDERVRVRIFTAEQIERNKENSKCHRPYNIKTKTIRTICPEGVEYQEVTPEEFWFSVKDNDTTIEVNSKTINVGDTYVLSVIGRFKDNCNTVSASVEGIAHSETTVLQSEARTVDKEKLWWTRTQKACIKMTPK